MYVQYGLFADEAEAREKLATLENPVKKCKDRIHYFSEYVYQTKGEPMFLFEKYDRYDYDPSA